MVFGTQGVPPKTLTKIASKKCTTKDLGVRFCAFVNAPPSFPFSTFRPEFDTICKIRFSRFPIYIFHRTKLTRWPVSGVLSIFFRHVNTAVGSALHTVKQQLLDSTIFAVRQMCDKHIVTKKPRATEKVLLLQIVILVFAKYP